MFAITAIIMYGSSQAAQKLALNGMSVASMILFSILIALPMFGVVLVYIITTGEFWTIPPEHWLFGILGSTFGQIGYYTYVEAVKRGPISIVSSLTATYPVMVAIVAIVFLSEIPTLFQGVGVIIVTSSMVALSYFHGKAEDKKVKASGKYLAICVLTMLMWAFWAIFTKFALEGEDGMSNLAFLSVYTFVIPPVTLAYYKVTSVKLRTIWPKWGMAVKIAIVSSIVGNLAYFLEITAVDNGPAPVVFPLIASSPVVVILLAYAFLKERLSKKEWLLAACVVVGIVLVSTA